MYIFTTLNAFAHIPKETCNVAPPSGSINICPTFFFLLEFQAKQAILEMDAMRKFWLYTFTVNLLSATNTNYTFSRGLTSFDFFLQTILGFITVLMVTRRRPHLQKTVRRLVEDAEKVRH